MAKLHWGQEWGGREGLGAPFSSCYGLQLSRAGTPRGTKHIEPSVQVRVTVPQPLLGDLQDLLHLSVQWEGDEVMGVTTCMGPGTVPLGHLGERT